MRGAEPVQEAVSQTRRRHRKEEGGMMNDELDGNSSFIIPNLSFTT
jgi:hypothetical protein